MPNVLTFEEVTPEKIANMKTKLGADHDTAVRTAPDGTFNITGHGVVANAVYNPAKEELTVTVEHHPFYIPIGAIEKGIENNLKES